MKMTDNFQLITDLPIYSNLLQELEHLLTTKSVSWTGHKQICLNTTADEPDNFSLGAGSLVNDWDNRTINQKTDGLQSIDIPRKSVILTEKHFTTLCSQFIGTSFEKLYRDLESRYVLGRVRIMKMDPKTCLSWHVDTTPRLHYPLQTQEGCLMVIEDEAKFLPRHAWHLTNTVKKHTAFNGSTSTRIHIVACVFERRNS
jgi:hypothetical protein